MMIMEAPCLKLSSNICSSAECVHVTCVILWTEMYMVSPFDGQDWWFQICHLKRQTSFVNSHLQMTLNW
jgi:hypothetical protein